MKLSMVRIYAPALIMHPDQSACGRGDASAKARPRPAPRAPLVKFKVGSVGTWIGWGKPAHAIWTSRLHLLCAHAPSLPGNSGPALPAAWLQDGRLGGGSTPWSRTVKRTSTLRGRARDDDDDDDDDDDEDTHGGGGALGRDGTRSQEGARPSHAHTPTRSHAHSLTCSP